MEAAGLRQRTHLNFVVRERAPRPRRAWTSAVAAGTLSMRHPVKRTEDRKWGFAEKTHQDSVHPQNKLADDNTAGQKGCVFCQDCMCVCVRVRVHVCSAGRQQNVYSAKTTCVCVCACVCMCVWVACAFVTGATFLNVHLEQLCMLMLDLYQAKIRITSINSISITFSSGDIAASMAASAAARCSGESVAR